MLPIPPPPRGVLLVLQDRPEDYEQARGKYIIDRETLKIMRKDAIIMHPLPRVDEVCSFPQNLTSVFVCPLGLVPGQQG